MRDATIFTAGLTAVIVVPVLLLVWLVTAITFPGELAQIEQLRADAAHVDPAQAEDVIGQVTQWNQTIASNQAYNDVVFIGIFIPDGWDDIEPIAVPQ